MYIHVQRQFSTKRKGCEFCFDLNTFTYVSSTKRDSVVGVEIRVDGEVDGWEACRGPGGRQEAGPRHSCPPTSLPAPRILRASAEPLAPPQTSHSSGWSLVCSRSGWLCLVSFCQVLEGLHSSVVCWCLWEPHLLRCEATPWGYFCSCCFTCCTISLILRCAVWLAKKCPIVLTVTSSFSSGVWSRGTMTSFFFFYL